MLAKKKVGVVGGGIIGISSALAIVQRLPNVQLTVIADHFTPDTTGDGAAGLWMPYLLGESSLQATANWAKQTFMFLEELFLHQPESGVSLMSGYAFDASELENAFWKNVVYGYAPMSRDELNLVGASYGVKFTSFVSECRKLLPFLMNKLEKFGCTFIKRKIDSLDELADDFDVIVNCPGVMARSLVCDQRVHPIRGQIMKVAAPWIKMFFISEDHYIIPNSEWVVLGGTHQRENWSTDADEADRNHIINGCSRLVPSIQKAKVLSEWVGLRPGRDQVRLEAENVKTARKTIKVVHNYGHGGSGVTVFWGCAQQTARLVEDAFKNTHSKL